MSEVQKSVTSFKSSNGICEVAAYTYICEAVTPRAILQISHGMCEHISRYDAFAQFMAQNGYIVCGNDHLGHGKTSDNKGGIDGYFGDKNGREYVLRDLHEMNNRITKAYPGLPVVLLGHSMGSFFARLYAVTYPDTIAALVLSGTGGPNPLGGAGLLLTSLLAKVKGPQYRSALVNNMAFGAYLKQIPNHRTQYDWISADEQIVDIYQADPKCTFVFTVSAFHELMTILRDVNSPLWASKLNKAMPIYLFSGDKDPVGDYGKGLAIVKKYIEDAGVKDFTFKLYPNGRHEMLNEINRDAVFTDVLNWCNSHV